MNLVIKKKALMIKDRTIGTVKWFNDNKGFGFIESEGKEYFVHYSCIRNERNTLANGALVSFKIIEGQKGPLAEEVEIVR